MNVFTNYLEKLGSNFLVASMVPSLALVVASLLVFEPIFKITQLFEKQTSTYQLVGSSLFIFLLTVIIGFTLTALNTYILKFYEGYVFFHRIPSLYRMMIRSQKRKAHLLSRTRDILRKRIEGLERSFEATDRNKKQLKRLRDLYYKTAAEYDLNYPPNPSKILPMKFGNILKASESYPGERYGLDGVLFWPRLIYVIPPEYRNSIDNTRNELSFLLNMSILCIAFYFLCVFISIYSFSIQPEGLSGLDLFINRTLEALRYLTAAAISFVLSILFYKASIYSVGSFGMMIRSSYDLFRINLLKKFHLPMPTNLDEEFFKWKNLNEFVVLGKHSLTFDGLEYKIDPKQD